MTAAKRVHMAVVPAQPPTCHKQGNKDRRIFKRKNMVHIVTSLAWKMS